MKSSKFKLNGESKVDFNLSRGMSTLTCFSKKPRTTTSSEDLSESPLKDCNNPEVTRKLETISIDCDSDAYKNGSVLNSNKPLCTDIVEQTSCISLDVGAATANHQQAVVEPQTSHRHFEQMENRPLWKCVQLASNNNC